MSIIKYQFRKNCDNEEYKYIYTEEGKIDETFLWGNGCVERTKYINN